MIIDGLVIHGCARSGANAYPNEHLFVMPTTDPETGSPIKAGDLCVLFDLANNSTGAGVSVVTPTGFTNFGSAGGTDAAGNGAACAISWKILVTADIGATFTGMNGTENERKMCCVFRVSRPVRSVTTGSVSISGPTSGNPAANTITVPGSSTGNILVMGMACAENAITSLENWGPGSGSQYVSPADATDALGQLTATRAVYVYYPYGVAPANQIFDIGTFITFDTGASCGFYMVLG